LKQAGLAAAVVARTLELVDEHGFPALKAGNGIGELDFAAAACVEASGSSKISRIRM
jgi:hypothetical protein